jgi:hypothetical protein
MYSKTIEISKEQYNAVSDLIDSNRDKFSQFSASESANKYALTIFVDVDFKKAIDENPNHRFAKIHAIIPLFEKS